MADFIVNIVPSTELEAVNDMLAAIGVAPVTDLTTTTSRDAILAKSVIFNVAREVLLERWRFNSEFGVQVLPSQKITWIDDIDGTTTELNVFEVPVRGQSSTKQRSLLRWEPANFANILGVGFMQNIAVALQSPTSNELVDGAPQAITNISAAAAAVVTVVGHGYIDGQSVVIAGTDSTPVIDGTQKITVIDSDTFSVPVTTTGAGTTGTATNETPQLIFYDTRLGRDGFALSERDALYIDATWAVDFVDMPQTARDYITKRAARRFAQQVVGSPDMARFTAFDENLARRSLRRDQKPNRKLNFLNNPNTRLAHGRNRFVVNSQIDSAAPRGGTA